MWGVEFFEMEISVDDLKEFVAQVVQASQKHQIAEVKAAPGYGKFPDYIARPDYSYIDYIEEIVQQAGIFPFFQTYSASLSNNLIETKICYYNKKGNIEAQAVTNLGRLLREIHPELSEREHGDVLTANLPPVTITCTPLEVQDGMIKNDWFTLNLGLNSDIWFPKIYGLLENDSIERKYRNMPYDNSALANCHTARLNQFLLAVRQATLDIGATWGSAPNLASKTRDMVTEAGIKLDLQDN